MNIIEIFKLSIDNLLSFKFRSFLTMLGIIMGIASVILISSLGAGFQSKLLLDVKKSTSSLIIVDFSKKYNKSNNIKQSDFFKKDDINTIEKMPEVTGVVFNKESLLLDKKSNRYLHIKGIDKKYFDILKIEMIEGRKFEDFEYNLESNKILIDRLSAKQLFKNKSSLGQEIEIVDFNNKYIGKFVIIGTFKGLNEGFSSIAGETAAVDVLMSGNVLDSINQNYSKRYSELMVSIKDPKKIQEEKIKISKLLENRGSQKDLYNVRPFNEEIKQITNILDKIEVFINLIASISIIVGGVGVMNIMLVSVKERITEIGLRKAIGAKNKDIMFQFLLETMIITILGGLIGILLGYGIAAFIGIFIKVIPILKIKTLLISLFVSSITGLLFGIYPAKQASKLSPIEALRKE